MFTMRPMILLFWTGMLLANTCGCNDSDVKDRLRQTIEDLQKYGGPPGALDALKNATVTSLERPQITRAVVIEKDASVTMLIDWIETTPSAESVVISCPEGDYKWEWIIDSENRRENLRKSEHHVLFDVVHAFDRDCDEWLNLREALRGGACTVSLWRDGEAVSNTVDLRYSR